MQALIKTERLTKVYKMGVVPVAALRHVDLDVDEGRFVGVAGPSGSGKSTLMNLLGGLDRPSVGRIYVRGRCITDLKKDDLARYRLQEVGMIFQSFNLISAYTAAENVAFPLLFAGVAKKQRKQRAEAMLDRVGLAQRRNHHPPELSGGEQQRVAIARALINEPRILLADEPTGNLDSATSREIVRILAELNKTAGLTVIMISHEKPLLSEFADKVVYLRDGMIVGQQDA